MIAKNITARLARRFRRFRATSIGEFVAASVLFTVIGASFVPLLFTAGPTFALAVDATWQGGADFTPNNWNSGANWVGGRAPLTTNDTATFGFSTNTSPTLSANVTIQSVTFTTNASAFTIQTGFGTFGTLTLQGDGIVNNSGIVQTITNAPESKVIESTHFRSNATAGVNVAIINAGSTITDRRGGDTRFFDTSNAGSAALTNNGATVSSPEAGGGFTEFSGKANAGSATIVNNSGTNGGSGGITRFLGSSDGGTARVIANGNGALDNGNGALDISGLTTTSMGIGSIEGSGNYFLGSKNLIVGGNNLNTTVSGIIRDGGFLGGTGGSLTKVGTGTLTLTGTNTYSGGANLNGGILAVNTDSNLGTGLLLRFNGGTIEALAAGGGIDSSKAITLDAGGGTFLADAGTASTLSGAITGAGAWTKAGPGTLTLSGNNTYSGATLVNEGTLRADSSTAFSPNSAFTVNAELDLRFSNAIGSLAGEGIVTNEGITLATLEIGNDNTSTRFGGSLQNGVNALGLTKVGTGTLTLTGTNTYSGDTNLNEGILAVNTDSNLGTGLLLRFNGGTLEALAAGGGIDSSKAITLDAGGGTFLADAGTASTLSGAITGAGAWTKAGPGTLTLSGNNTYSGATLVNEGTLRADSSTAFSPNSAFTVNAELDLNGFSNTIGSLTGNGIVTNNGILPTLATLEIGNDNTSTTFSGSLQNGVNTLGLTKIATGTLTLTGANTYTGGTTISVGTLQLGNGGTTGSIAGDVLNNGILAFNRRDFVTFNGLITGTGGVQQNGTGMTMLLANNSYAGGTTINAGVLQLGNGGTTGSILGDVSNNGILAFNRSDSFTFNGLISGTGGVQQNGTGTTVLVADNSYIGGTTINAGILQLGNGGTTGSILGDVINNGILALNRSDFVTFDGLISGTGGVQQNGTGTTVLVANNTYTGGTTINAGALQLGDGGTTGSIVGDVIDNGALIFNRSDAVTFDGVISGTGDLVKLGAGTLTLPGANTYTGATTVNAGSLIVDGSIASAQTVVNPSGLLGGRGIIGGNLVNSGVVSPGSSPETLTVNGNYTQNPSGTLRIEVAGGSPGQFDVLAVKGHASLAGTVQLVRLGGFNLSLGDQITFLTASSVSGTFDTVENDFLATGFIVVFDVVYLPDGVVLEGTQGSFAEFAAAFCGTPNAVAVGQALDSAVGDPGVSELIGVLNSNQTSSDLCNDIDLISPEQLTSIFGIGVALANVQTAHLQRQMDVIQNAKDSGEQNAGGNGFSSAGFVINGSGPSFSEGFTGVSGPEGKSGPAVFAPIPQNRWGVFVTGIGEFTNVGNTFNASGYELATGGFTMGIDYRIGSNFAIGLTGGYAYTRANLVNDGSIQVNGGKLGLYATAFGSGFYLDTAVIGGLSGYDTRRTALVGTASGSTEGGDLNVLVAGGYDWKKGGLSIGPTASFQYTYVGFNDFTESGSLAPLAFPDQHAESFRTAFGMKASYDWKIGPIRVIPEVRAAWQHEFGDTEYSLVSSFANGAGNSFTVNGPEIGRDSLLLSAGFAIQWNDRISTYAYYDGELFRTNYLSNNVSAGFRITF